MNGNGNGDKKTASSWYRPAFWAVLSVSGMVLAWNALEFNDKQRIVMDTLGEHGSDIKVLLRDMEEVKEDLDVLLRKAPPRRYVFPRNSGE